MADHAKYCKTLTAKAIARQESISKVLEKLTSRIDLKRQHSHSSIQLINTFMAENMCYEIAGISCEDLESDLHGSNVLISINKRAISHDHSSNLDYFQILTNRVIRKVFYFTGEDENCIIATLGYKRWHENMKKPGIENCINPLERSTQWNEPPTQVSNQTFSYNYTRFDVATFQPDKLV